MNDKNAIELIKLVLDRDVKCYDQNGKKINCNDIVIFQDCVCRIQVVFEEQHITNIESGIIVTQLDHINSLEIQVIGKMQEAV